MEMQAIIKHELCHLRRRDNLMAALHMLVEAVFWFHPLVWWLGARLIEERERACDENVLAAGTDPEAYAQGILKICQFHFSSPLASASGVSGADLKKRLSAIMENKAVLRVTAGRKAALIIAATLLAILPPLVVGLIGAQPASAQAANPAFGEAMPRSAVSIDAGAFDKYVGYYRFADGTTLHVTRNGGRYFVQQTARRPLEIMPESGSKFFAKTDSVPVQVSFEMDAAGMAIAAVLHQGGHDYRARRIRETTLEIAGSAR